jgi:sec-independent protein translocase protein TatA
MSTSYLGFLGPVGGPEMIMIFVVILLLFGAKKLPELARGVGKSMGEFKKAREEFEREITRSEEEVSRDEKAKETRVKPAADKETHDA